MERILNCNGKKFVFEEKENGCLICTSHCKDNFGYTRARINGKHIRLHRFLYEEAYGKIPFGLVVRHKCDNPACCNIEHLELGTQLDNINDMITRGRVYKGEKIQNRGVNNKANKLSEKQIKEIFLSPLGSRKLSKLYEVSKTTILDIKKQKTWKWLTDTF